MKELSLIKQGKIYICNDGDYLIYEGMHTQAKGTSTLTIKNAHKDEIFSFTYTKSGFRLFRGNKPVSIDIRHNEQSGVLQPEQKCYLWELEECAYTFVCGQNNDQVDIIMRDRQETLGYVKQGKCHVQHLMYSAELCGVWMLMQDMKDKILMDTESFQRAMEVAEQI